MPGTKNDLADDLSRDRLYFQGPITGFRTSKAAPRNICTAAGGAGLDLASLDDVRFYCDRRVAESMRRTYKSGLHRFLSFCNAFGVVSPFPVVYLVGQGISPATVKAMPKFEGDTQNHASAKWSQERSSPQGSGASISPSHHFIYFEASALPLLTVRCSDDVLLLWNRSQSRQQGHSTWQCISRGAMWR